MLFDEMSQVARNVVTQRMSSNMPLSFNDTICVAYTSSSKIYVGVSSVTMVNNMPMQFHAEVDMCNNVMRENDTAIQEMAVFNAASLQPMLPCTDCAARIMAMNPANSNTLVLLPTQNVALSQMGAYIQSQSQPQMPMGQGMVYNGMPVNMGQYQAMPYGGMPMQGMGQPMPAQQYAMPGQPQQYAMPPQTPAQPAAPATSQYAGTKSQYTETTSQYLESGDTDSGSYLKGRLDKLFSVEDEMDIEDMKAKKAQEKAAQKKKRKFFKEESED
jgi:cytidine deaminase